MKNLKLTLITKYRGKCYAEIRRTDKITKLVTLIWSYCGLNKLDWFAIFPPILEVERTYQIMKPMILI